jgi:hypothetical protein
MEPTDAGTAGIVEGARIQGSGGERQAVVEGEVAHRRADDAQRLIEGPDDLATICGVSSVSERMGRGLEVGEDELGDAQDALRSGQRDPADRAGPGPAGRGMRDAAVQGAGEREAEGGSRVGLVVLSSPVSCHGTYLSV